VYAKEHLLGNVLGCVPTDLSRDEWLAALPRALVAGFVKTDKDFQTKGDSNSFPFMKPTELIGALLPIPATIVKYLLTVLVQ
jgi:hypothetical protein